MSFRDHADPATPQIIHASTVAVDGRAVIIRGASGSGKSGLALQLMAMGAGLVADDRTSIWCDKARLMAEAPDTIRGKIEARGVGVLNAPDLGAHAVSLVVDMDEAETERVPPFRETQILDLPIPLLRKSSFAHFPAAILLYLRHGRWQ